MFLSRALSRLCFGSNSHARRRSSNRFTPARRLRSPAADFDYRAQLQPAEILRVTLRKSLSVGCPWLPFGHLLLQFQIINRVELIGFLGSEPEANYTPNGKAVTSLSLATKTSWIKDGQRQERTEWHRIQAWGKLAEYAAGFKKGAHVRVEGELRSREYETDTGVKVRTYVIVASSIMNLRPGQRMFSSEPEPEPAAAVTDEVVS